MELEGKKKRLEKEHELWRKKKIAYFKEPEIESTKHNGRPARKEPTTHNKK